MKTDINQLMHTSGVKFGTSGVRGLVSQMNDQVCFAYTLAFLQHLNTLKPVDRRVAIAGDLRSSTGRIMAAVAQSIQHYGYEPVHCGRIPSPAVALFGIQQKIASVMVTGSHIPDDRNGIKFNRPDGEILKDDEIAIGSQAVDLPELFDESGMLRSAYTLQNVSGEAAAIYVQRYVDAMPGAALSGMKIGLYEHSAVGRDLLHEIFTKLGCDVVRLGRSDTFVPVDTEAIRDEDVQLARQWAAENQFDAIISTDGDSDRPLISDEKGQWLRGDQAGILTAKHLNAEAVVTPVSCNTAVEKCGSFRHVRRTRIGSPFVISGMQAATREGFSPVVGYEANGGFLTNSPCRIEDGEAVLAALPTRDPMIVQVAILRMAMLEGCSISKLTADLPQRFTASGRLQQFPTEKSRQIINRLLDGGASLIESKFPMLGPVQNIDATDGLRITFATGNVMHLRPSGNAPELRCYTESDSKELAEQIVEKQLQRVAKMGC